MGHVGARKTVSAHFDGVLCRIGPATRGTMLGFAGAIERVPGFFDVDAFRRSLQIGWNSSPVAFRRRSDIGQRFLVADRKERRVVLGLIQPFIADPPKLLGANSGHACCQLTPRSMSQSGWG